MHRGMSVHPVTVAPTTLRERKKAKTRREIASVAIELFRTRGYGHSDRVAARLACSR